MPGQHVGPLRIAIEDFLETFGFGRHIKKWITGFTEDQEEEIRDAISDALAVIPDNDNIPAIFKRLREGPIKGKLQGGLATLGGFALNMGMTAASGFLAPLARLLNYSMDKKLLTARADPAAIITLAFRNAKVEQKIFNDLAELGWDGDYIAAWIDVLKQRVGVGEWVQLWLRGGITDLQFAEELTNRGFPLESVEHVKTLSKIIPPVQDLIRMAVREAFTPEVVAKFELESELPGDFVTWAKRLGLSEEWTRHYWAAHWELPSIQLGYEMFHRLRPGVSDNPFTLDDLKLLIKTQDISPVWRDRLVDISYSPYTRVDVRRMFDVNVLDEKGVYEAYLDLGYNDERAKKLTAFTIKERRSEEKELTRPVIISGYKRKMLSDSEAIAALLDMGYDDKEAQFFIALADFELSELMQKEVIDGVEFLYIEGAIDTVTVYEKLGPLNLPATEVEQLLTIWNIRREKKVALPTRQELESFYKESIITEDQLIEGLKQRRYRQENIGWYLQRLDNEIASEARVELERAQKEQERIIDAARASVYMKAKAESDVRIAEAKVSIAEIKATLHEVTEQATITSMRDRIATLVVEIAKENLTKAQLRLEIEQS